MKTYIYRQPTPYLAATAAQRYDSIYQTAGWQTGMAYPVMAAEEGVARSRLASIAAVADNWMARFLMENQRRWETRRTAP